MSPAMKINKLYILILLFFGTYGCSSFLDTTPKDRVSDGLIWKDESRVTMYVNSFYPYIHDWGYFGNSQFAKNMTEGMTETLKYGSSAAGNRYGDANLYAMMPEKFSPDGGLLAGWGSAYTGIRRVNEFLVSLGKYSTLSPEKNKVFEAQAKFFRAFLYFQLAKRHGGVILYTDMDLQKDKDRSSAEDTWNLIASDLDFAATALPIKWDQANNGRVTKGAAFALKSRAMLYAERWEAAKVAADSVIELGIYGLENSYANATKGGNCEAILEYDYLATADGPNHDFDLYYAPYGDLDNLGGSAAPTQEMVEYYETKDGKAFDWSPWHISGGTTTRPNYESLEPRFQATVLYNGAQWKGKTMENCVDGISGRYMDYREDPYCKGRTTTGYYLKKFLDENNKSLQTLPSTTPTVEIRLAEVYLNRAEANFRLHNEGAALSDINIIRKRVNLPDKVGLSGNDLFNAIRRERTIELCYEGHLYWDMRRWKRSHIEYNKYRVHGLRITKDPVGYRFEYVDADLEDRKFDQRTYVLPVPQTEFTKNSLIRQYDEWK